jgi:hypothetical protein
MTMRAPRLSRTILWLLTAVQLLVGGWAVAAPRSFFDQFPGFGHHWTALLPPNNEHQTPDVGALSLALAVVTAAAAVALERRLVAVTALAWLGYSVPHLAFHLAHLRGVPAADQVGEVASLALGVAAPLRLLVGAAASPAATTTRA